MWLKVMSRLLNLDKFTEIRIVCDTARGWSVNFDSKRLSMPNKEEAEKFIREIAYAIGKGQALLEMYGEE